jgi:hypothetical protein
VDFSDCRDCHLKEVHVFFDSLNAHLFLHFLYVGDGMAGFTLAKDIPGYFALVIT